MAGEVYTNEVIRAGATDEARKCVTGLIVGVLSGPELR